MFSVSVRNPFGCRGVSCVKLPATVAFPTDERLLARLEQSRRALPPNSVKPVRQVRAPEGSRPQSVRAHDGDTRPVRGVEVIRATVQRLPVREEGRSTLPPLVRIEELYVRSRVALGQR